MQATQEAQLHPARIIPVAGIRGPREQEQRATSALLAVIAAVPPFGRELLADLGAPRGAIRSYVEVPLRAQGSRKTVYPDGAIVAERGKRRWSCLVEVKTGDSDVEPEQVATYLDLARANGFDGVLVVSNDIMGGADEVPVELPARYKKRKSVALWQLSWWRIFTGAIFRHRHEGVDDATQAWILGELIAYLSHPSSGAGDFTDMGPSWVTVREGARHQTLRRGQPEVAEVAWRWEQFVHYVALGLSQQLGVEVSPVEKRGQTTQDRVADTKQLLADHGRIAATFNVPDTVGALRLVADLAARKVDVSVTVDAPGQGRAKTRVNWLLRQLKSTPDELRVEVRFERKRATSSALLRDARQDVALLLCPDDPEREPRSFEVSLAAPMSLKKGNRQGSFTEDTRQLVLRFYREIVQNLRPWQPPAPKLERRGRQRVEPEAASRQEPAPPQQQSSAPNTPAASGEPPRTGEQDRE